MRVSIPFLLLAVFAIPLSAQDAQDKPVVALPDHEYRHDPFWNFDISGQNLDCELSDLEKAASAATPKERADALMRARFRAGSWVNGEKAFLEFAAKTKFPPKAAAIMAPVVEYLKTPEFQRARAEASKDLGRADIAQLRALYDVYAKVPWLPQHQLNHYIDEAYFQGDPKLRPGYDSKTGAIVVP